jgi:glycosyltransferase involved in cell wall biosynthesis
VCPNRYTERYVIGLGVRQERTRVIPFRLPEEFFDRSAPSPAMLLAHGVDLARPIVLYVGRLERDKQVELLVEAARLVANKIPEAQFVFVGDGTLRPRLKMRAHELGLASQCWFVGFQSTANVRACLAYASVVWIPMSGWVVYEAASQARAIVAFDVEWHSEFVEDGVTGLLVEDRNVSAISDAVVRVLSDGELAAALGRAARARLEVDFDARRLVELEQEAYGRLLEETA